MRSSEAQWKKFGAIDPYFGVISHERFRSEKLTAEGLQDFWASGREHVEHLVDIFHNHFSGTRLQPKRALDFGCGVGRILKPLSEISESVVGVDVSPGMLAEARKNCPRAVLAPFPYGQFDFIHTYIVLQHVERKIGMRIIADLLGMLNDGGLATIHATFRRNFRATLRQRFPLMANIAKGRKWNYPSMRMEEYSLPDVFALIEPHSRNIFIEMTNHSGVLGCTIYLAKDRQI